MSKQKCSAALAGAVLLLVGATGLVLNAGSGVAAPFPKAGSPVTVMSTPLKLTCRVTNTVSTWDDGLVSEITIAYSGFPPARGWSLVFTLPAGQTITSGWNATYSPSSGQVTATNAPHNANIDNGQSVSIGFLADHTGDTSKPTSFTLNGLACTNG